MLAAILALFISAAHAQTVQTYAVICTTACQGTDANGNPVTEPAGYVQDIILWNGVAVYSPGLGLELKPAGTLQIGQVTTP